MNIGNDKYQPGNTSLDVLRHGKVGIRKAQAFKSKFVNMLYADFHAVPVTPNEVYKSVIITQ